MSNTLNLISTFLYKTKGVHYQSGHICYLSNSPQLNRLHLYCMKSYHFGVNSILRLYCIYSQTCRNGHLLITVTFVLSLCILLYILIRYSGHLFNVVSRHHLLIISSVKPLYNGKFIFKIIPEMISKVLHFSQM